MPDSAQNDAGPIGLSQRGRLGFLLRDSVLYGGAGALSKAFALITFPLLARHFSVSEYGVLDFFLVLATVMALLFIFGQDTAVARFFYEHDDQEERQQIITQSLWLQVAGVVIMLPVLWILAGPISSAIIDNDRSMDLFRIVLCQIPFIILINFSQNILKWTFQRAKFLIVSLGFTVVQATLLIVAVKVVDTDISGVLVVSACTSLCFGILGLIFVRSWLVRPAGFHHLRSLIPFAVPYGLVAVMSAFSPTLERMLTVQLLDTESLGLYAAGAKAAMLIGLLVTAFQTAWGPFSLSLYRQANAGITYNWVLKFFSISMCVSVLALSIIAYPLIYLLASDRFIGAVVVVFPLAMALAIQATSWITEIGISLSKRSHLNLYGYAVSLCVTFGVITLLAPLIGLAGVGVGVLLGQVAKAAVASWLAQRAYPLPWTVKPVIGLFAFSSLLGGSGIVAQQQYGVWAYTVMMCLTLVGAVLIGWCVVLDAADRRRVIDVGLSLTLGRRRR